MNKKFKLIVMLLAAALITIIVIIFARMQYVIHAYEGLIYPGISINEIDVSCLNRERAMEKVSTSLREFNESRIIKVQVDEKSYETSFVELKIAEDLDEVLDIAMNYGKKDSFFDKYRYIKEGMDRNFKTTVSIDDDSFQSFVKTIEKEQNKSPINATIEHDWSGFKVTTQELGRKLDVDELKREIKESIEAGDGDEIVIVDGDFTTEYPRIMENQLKTIDTLVSSYTTSFGSSSFGRCRNIEVAARYVNDFVLLPNEEFSFNKVVGAATSEKGYQYAKVIKNGTYADEIGGGVCQVSSTLFNALLKTKLEVTERKNHSKAISYVPLGQDAMISYGASDLKFKNNFDYPIMLESIVANKQITFNIYSNSHEKGKNYQIVTETAKVIKPRRETIYDYGLSEGTVIVEQQGKNGYVVNTYRVLYEGGKEKERQFVTESIYPGKNSRVRIGKD